MPLSATIYCYMGSYMLLYVAICCYRVLYAAICCYRVLYAAICCYMQQQPVGNIHLETSTWKHPLGNIHLETSTWKHWLFPTGCFLTACFKLDASSCCSSSSGNAAMCCCRVLYAAMCHCSSSRNCWKDPVGKTVCF